MLTSRHGAYDRNNRPKPAVINRGDLIEINCNWGTYTLAAGLIDDDAVTVFSRGQCHAFAIEMHKKTGWEIVGLFRGDWEFESNSTPGHCAVRHPDGRVIDIEGAGADERWENKYDGSRVEPQSLERILSYERIDYRPPDLEGARPFVEAVLETL